MLCPCGSKKNYADCCGVFIEGHDLPDTPERLMRSRFTAYKINRIEYIEQTMRGEPSIGFNLDEVRQANKRIKWLNLTVTNAPTPIGDTGSVEFSARYLLKGTIHTMRENSLFHFQDGQWFYVGTK